MVSALVVFFRGGGYFLRYPHLGQTPSALRAMPQRGQRSISLWVSKLMAAALTPLVNLMRKMLCKYKNLFIRDYISNANIIIFLQMNVRP